MLRFPRKPRTVAASCAAVALAAGGVLAYPHLPYQVQHPFAQATTNADGASIFQRDGKTSVTSDGRKYAPDPPSSFRNHTCDLTPQAKAHPEPSTWTAPTINQHAPLNPTPATESRITLPDAPAGIVYTAGSPLTSPTGITLDAGHVDYGAGVLSKSGGELSPWGHLHELSPCAHIYQANAEGQVREFVVTDLYRVPQADLVGEDLWRKTGAKELVLVTCAGGSTEQVGDSLAFDYSHNLVVKASPTRT